MSEGIRRLAVAVRWVGYIAAGLVALFFIMLAAIESQNGWIALVIGAGCAAAVAASGWAAGWIIEGFAKR